MSLEYQLDALCHDRKGKSYAAQTDRRRIARQMARDLTTRLGYNRKLTAQDLVGRHVNKLVQYWMYQNLSIGTIKNRMATARWIYERLGKGHMLLKTNEEYGIPKRIGRKVPRVSDINDEILSRIDSKHADYIRVSLRLMRYCGLRFEESVKLRPSQAIERNGDGAISTLHLQGSWCKNGRERSLTIRTDEQREILEEAVAIAGKASLVHRHYDYDKWRGHFYDHCGKAGIHDRHGLRHAYAHDRYRELTGRPAPMMVIGTSEEVDLGWVDDDRARLVISSELGHSRKAIAAAYVGKGRS